MSKMNYELKYKELRSKLLRSTNVAYRLGYEQGLKDSQIDQMNQQKAEQQQMRQAAMGGQFSGQPEQEQPEQGGAEPTEAGAKDGQLENLTNQQKMKDNQNQADSDQMQNQEAIAPEQGSELDKHIAQLEGLVAKGERPAVLDMREAVMKLSALRKSQKEELEKKQSKSNSAQKKLVDSILSKWELDVKKESTSDFDKLLEEIEGKK